MQKFKYDQIQSLQEFLYCSCIHDAKFISFIYDYNRKNITIEAINAIVKTKISILFKNVDIVFAFKGNEFGDRETISSLCVEKNSSFLENSILKFKQMSKDYLYLVFEMFSGDEIHIISQEVHFEMLNL